VERAAILGNGGRLELGVALGATLSGPTAQPARASTAPAPALPPVTQSSADTLLTLNQAIIAHIERALQTTGGRIEGPFGAARLLAINPHTLRAKMRKLGINWARFRPTAVQ
jgi:transcriptional regulator with GAF, ATPase, and Fis domain